ncbi:hypothetical protein QTO34_009938 [Cnephaeus nilssonii]|uniref:NADH dehydrogenase [ubiquinone] 1 alpha subcomplex subunit 3 n=1 Tax=Cnephaeus nilssonii TaxID=3371016 RepID=A0AA40HEF8_CNENI|nr:hypothetical protein QTO34_009938 [Eptesicus nilssonii]
MAGSKSGAPWRRGARGEPGRCGAGRGGAPVEAVGSWPEGVAEVTRGLLQGRGIATFIRDAWAKEPVLVASCAIGSLSLLLPFISPYTKYAIMINEVTPYNYPVPSETMGTCLMCPATPRTPRAEAWSG